MALVLKSEIFSKLATVHALVQHALCIITMVSCRCQLVPLMPGQKTVTWPYQFPLEQLQPTKPDESSHVPGINVVRSSADLCRFFGSLVEAGMLDTHAK